MNYIDRRPSPPSGDEQKDINEVYGYLLYLQEQINYILRIISKKLEG